MKHSFLKTLMLSQINMMISSSTSERLKYMTCKVEDGKAYDGFGNVCGTVADGEDVVFITEEELSLSRITGVKLTQIENRIKAYFGVNDADAAEEFPTFEPEDYDDNEEVEEVEETTFEPKRLASVEEVEDEEEPKKDKKDKKDKKKKKNKDKSDKKDKKKKKKNKEDKGDK